MTSTKNGVGNEGAEDGIVKLNDKVGSNGVFFICLVEENLKLLKGIVGKLNVPCWGIHVTHDFPIDLQKAADHSLKILKKAQPNGPYVLCAYSMAAQMTLDMAMKLEKEGHRVSLILLDGSPIFDQSLNLSVMENSTDCALEWSCSYILAYYISIFKRGLNYKKIIQGLKNEYELELQLTYLSDILTGGMDYEVIDKANAFVQRVLDLPKYKPDIVLNGEITIMTAAKSNMKINPKTQVNKAKVTVKTYDGNHTNLLTNHVDSVANTIKSHLN